MVSATLGSHPLVGSRNYSSDKQQITELGLEQRVHATKKSKPREKQSRLFISV